MTQEDPHTDDSAIQISVTASTHKPSDTILASLMNGIRIPQSTNFELYQHKKRKLNDLIIHGENENLLYDGAIKDGENSVSGAPEYCLGLYDPTSRSLKLIRTKLIPTKTEPKKFLKVSENYEDMSKVTYMEQRNRLGAEFGTSRAKAALNSYKKNRVDASKLAESELDIAEGIQKTTDSMPNRAKLTEMIELENRLIPPYNQDATAVEDVYPLEGIISATEQNLIKVDVLLKEIQNGTEARKLLEYMPYYSENGNYLERKLAAISPDTQDAKLKLQIVYYISVLMGLYFNRRSRTKDKLLEELQNPPASLILNKCLETFTDYNGKRSHFYMDPMNEDRLICYILVLMLKLEDYSLAVSPLAQELATKPSKLSSLLRSLGCTSKVATVSEREAWGLPRSSGSYKISQLRVPFKLPPMIRRIPRGGQSNRH
ncbi:DEKNAAC101257 [Brettanomyces naardenensis]|uniref:DEKNAAC101257 n=1 Tax=Brettanomyces naardenensis TaxID=13370 RepID=A0A448YHL1_BRENA|nr:DEKNAAC101257 [Brettanomyces naardenensis]